MEQIRESDMINKVTIPNVEVIPFDGLESCTLILLSKQKLILRRNDVATNVVVD